MPRQIPFPTRLKQETPEETQSKPVDINAKELRQEKPQESPKIESQPDITDLLDVKPKEKPLIDEKPKESLPKSEFPSDVNPENCVTIGGKVIELKPTKVKYFRNKTASAYGWLKVAPLTEFLTYGKGQLPQIDPDRDSDQILYDFLVAALDSSQIVRDNYDEMTADDVERIIKIFGRLNHIDEKEEQARKNREAQAAQKR
jgi:hypothetical protein